MKLSWQEKLTIVVIALGLALDCAIGYHNYKTYGKIIPVEKCR